MDIHADSGNRLPLIRREDLSPEDAEWLDKVVANPRSLAGLRGPAGIRLHSPALSRVAQPLQEYVRFHPAVEPKLTELTILVTARELDAQFEWTAHEPAARRAGLDPATIDVVKYRRATDGLDEREAAIIALGREAVGKHAVTSETFARAMELFGKELLLYFVALMGNYSATAILLATFDQHVPADQEPLLPLP